MIRRGGYKPAHGTRHAAKLEDWRYEVASSQTHAQLVLDIAKYLRLTRWLVLVTPRGGIPGDPGWPDLLAWRGRNEKLAIEVKAGRDELRVEQIAKNAELEERGFTCIEARSLDDVIQVQTSANRGPHGAARKQGG